MEVPGIYKITLTAYVATLPCIYFSPFIYSSQEYLFDSKKELQKQQQQHNNEWLQSLCCGTSTCVCVYVCGCIHLIPQQPYGIYTIVSPLYREENWYKEK